MAGRKPGPDEKKIALILQALAASEKGLWVRELSRVTGLKKSTVSLYIKEHLKDDIEEVHQNIPVKIVKLKKKTKFSPDYVS
jgi:hypothetical protein